MPTLARHKSDGTVTDVHEALALLALARAMDKKMVWACMVCGGAVEPRPNEPWAPRFEHLEPSSSCLD